MPNGIDLEWLTRTMADCSSADESTRRAAWEELARAIWPQMINVARMEQSRSWAWAAGPTVTEDAAMHAFIKLMSYIDRVEPPKLFGWVRVVARNYIISLGNHGFYKHESTSYDEDRDSAADAAAYRDQSRQLSAAPRLLEEMAIMWPTDREILYERFWLLWPLQKIAEKHGMSPPWVRHRIHVATGRLRVALIKAGYTDSSGATTDFG